ncbi:MAG: TolC family protein [Phycisphaerales bacterium]
MLGPESTPGEYVAYALFHSPEVEAAYQRWLAAGERLPQVGALPDPRLSVGFFVDEVETRVGPQQARVGVQQSFPWPGTLGARRDAASRSALAAWRRFQDAGLGVTDRVLSTLYELAYLDAVTKITGENLDLLRSFEEVVRARYRVGAGTHPELIRVQVELGLLEDRMAQLRAMRPSYAAALNAALNRPASAEVPPITGLPERVVAAGADELAELAMRSNPGLLAMDEEAEAERAMTEVARKDGMPGLTLGLDYIVTGDSPAGPIPESGDDPIMLSFGISLPIWREKYEAGVRESVARRLAVSHERAGEANRIAAEVHRAWFEHMDADRRVRLYENTLIPKAQESLRASLTGFRAGETDFLDLLDTERTLLEFAIAQERARADRGRALSHLTTLIGSPAATRDAAAGGAREATP